ncbi:MAG TPA: response regulator transcription factor [Kofleriaceae bacterium]
MKVLIADHSDVVRSRLVARLRESGLEVVGEADSLATATSLARELQPDAIVTDVKFADARGADVVRAVRELAPKVLLVVLSNTLHFRQLCMASGADYFLDKSTEFEEVVMTLARRSKLRM